MSRENESYPAAMDAIFHRLDTNAKSIRRRLEANSDAIFKRLKADHGAGFEGNEANTDAIATQMETETIK